MRMHAFDSEEITGSSDDGREGERVAPAPRLTSPRRVNIRAEVVAGLSLAAVGIPISMGYASVAQMPLSTALYTMIVPAIAYGIFGSSRHLVVSVDSATAAILAAGLIGLAPAASGNYVALAGLVAGMTGLALLLARIFHLGFIANFLSRTLLAGFLMGVAVSIAFQQLPKMLGIPDVSGTPLAVLWTLLQRWHEVSIPTLVVSAACIVVLLVGTRLKSLPTEFVVIVIGIAVASALGLQQWNIQTVGDIQGGLPVLLMPTVPYGAWPQLITTALSLMVVILAQSTSLARAYAAKYDEPFDAHHDLVGLGVANLASMASGSFVVNGSVTKTAIADRMGSRTKWAVVVSAGVALVVVFMLTGALSRLPAAVLAAVVLWIALGLLQTSTLRLLFRQRRDEWVISIATAAAVILFGVEFGVLSSVGLCLLNHVRHGYHPKNKLVTFGADGRLLIHGLAERHQAAPGLFVYRFQAGLYYANVEQMLDDVRELSGPDVPRCICIDFSAITDVDFTAGQVLLTMVERATALGIHIAFSHVSDEVANELRASGVAESDLIEFDAHVHALVRRYEAEAS